MSGAVLSLGLIIAAPAEARYASIVIDYDTGEVLQETNADTRNYPASLAKMMTLYLAFEALKNGDLTLDQELRVSRRATRMRPSRLGLAVGERITMRNAILALVTRSANDAAVVVAEALGKRETEFARMMTRKARVLGMSRTEFRNASGLAHRRQLSTARDMATLARALIRDFPDDYAIFSTRTFTYKGRAHRNHNRLLRKYPGVDGIKTGYIRASGFNLAASATRGGRRLIAVVMGGKSPRSRDRQVTRLLDRGFTDLASRTLWASGTLGKSPAPPTQKTSSTMAIAGIDPTAAAGSERIGPTPKAGPVETGSAADPSGSRIWGVQVGAYFRYHPALRAAWVAARRVPDILAGAHENVSILNGRRGRLYRARLVGLSNGDARRACRRLETVEIDCMVVKVGRSFIKLAARKIRKMPLLPTRKPAPAVAVASLAPSRKSDVADSGSAEAVDGPSPAEGLRPAGGFASAASPVAEERQADRTWGVQVGAYYHYNPALRAARTAAERVSELLSQARTNVSTLKGRRGRLYRARLVGLSESHARRACRRLETIEIDCLVVKVGRKLALIQDARRTARN